MNYIFLMHCVTENMLTDILIIFPYLKIDWLFNKVKLFHYICFSGTFKSLGQFNLPFIFYDIRKTVMIQHKEPSLFILQILEYCLVCDIMHCVVSSLKILVWECLSAQLNCCFDT